MQNPYLQMFNYQHAELERQARHENLVKIASRARRRNRKAAREAHALRLASDAVAHAGTEMPERRQSVQTGR